MRPARTRPGRWLQNLRISRKLAVVIAVHLLHATVLLVVTTYGIKAVDASRAWVDGEGFWSKAQKEGVVQLLAYARTGDEAHFQSFERNINVTLGDRQARLELEKSSPDLDVARAGFIQANNHPKDVDNMIWLFQTFRREAHINKAIGIWTQAEDHGIEPLRALADDLHREMRSERPDPARINATVGQILEVNADIEVLEQEFSRTLGDGARFITLVVVVGTVGLTILFVGSALLISATVARQITRSLSRVKAGAERMAAGDLGTQIEVEGRDDVAGVALAFNAMTLELATAEQARRAAFARDVEVRQLRDLNDMKTRLLNTASHELNTPLTPILLQLSVLTQHREGLDATQRKSVDILERNLTRLAGLVRDILDVARFQGGKLALRVEELDLGELAGHVVAGYAGRPGMAQTVVDIPQPVRLMADSMRLEQVFQNLLSNAHKFTDKDGRVTLRARVEGEHAIVEVEDTGIGMRPDQMERLFLPFSQVHDIVLTRQGTGLGLYISKGISEAHGGSMGCRSDGPGKGSTFWMRLPLAGPSGRQAT